MRLTGTQQMAGIARPQTGPWPVPISTSGRTTGDTSVGKIPDRPAQPWGKRGAAAMGCIMDNVERSFAAATAAGFVVLVIGLVLLALL
ncbi:hypothetical protein SE91_09550 [Bradyrhizobium sp. DOA1]|nr:hypothetical protein SE91_09550 [Bradyrhizobium sp. DOA1]